MCTMVSSISRSSTARTVRCVRWRKRHVRAMAASGQACARVPVAHTSRPACACTATTAPPLESQHHTPLTCVLSRLSFLSSISTVARPGVPSGACATQHSRRQHSTVQVAQKQRGAAQERTACMLDCAASDRAAPRPARQWPTHPAMPHRQRATLQQRLQLVLAPLAHFVVAALPLHRQHARHIRIKHQVAALVACGRRGWWGRQRLVGCARA
jgi:hypothetical protein